MPKRLFIIAGHSATTDPGATSTVNGRNYREANLAIEFRDLVITECRKLGLEPITDANNNALTQTLAWLKGLVFRPDSIMMDIHWNAASPSANGTEVIIPDNATQKERDLANDLLDVMSKYWRRRRVLRESETPRKRLGIFRPNMEQALIEVCFITNASDMTTYERVKGNLAKEVAEILHKHFVGEPIQNVYIVKTGDTLSRIAKENNTTVARIMANNKLTSDVIRVGQRLIL
jgi:N-acetylmuramoyl-L-alanine amidase